MDVSTWITKAVCVCALLWNLVPPTVYVLTLDEEALITGPKQVLGSSFPILLIYAGLGLIFAPVGSWYILRRARPYFSSQLGYGAVCGLVVGLWLSTLLLTLYPIAVRTRHC